MDQNELRLDRLSHIGSGSSLKVQRRSSKWFPLHAHDYYEIEIILEGSGQQFINGLQQPVCRGSTSFLSPADFHEVHPEKGTMLWNIAFDESFLSGAVPESLLTGTYQSFQIVPEETLRKLDMAAQLLLEEYQCGGSTRPLMEYILSLVIHGGGEEKPLSAMQKAILYVDTHFRDNPTLAQAAEQACLSPVYFGSLFRKVTGKTYVQYLNARKVDCAKMLLKSGVSVTDACFSAGFGSLSGFLHAFRQVTGVSPNVYRKQVTKVVLDEKKGD